MDASVRRQRFFHPVMHVQEWGGIEDAHEGIEPLVDLPCALQIAGPDVREELGPEIRADP